MNKSFYILRKSFDKNQLIFYNWPCVNCIKGNFAGIEASSRRKQILWGGSGLHERNID